MQTPDDVPPSRYPFDIHDAAEQGLTDRLEKLLATLNNGYCGFQDTAPSSRDHDECTALHVALINGHLDCVKKLLKPDIPYRFKRCEGSSVVHMAVCAGMLEHNSEFAPDALRLILESCDSLNVESLDEFQKQPIHYAAQYDLISCADILLKYKPELNLNHPDVNGDTPLHTACRYQSISMLGWLLRQQERPKIELKATNDNDNATSITTAALPLDVTMVNKKGQTCLHVSAISGFEKGIAELQKLEYFSTGAAGANVLDIQGLDFVQAAIKGGHHMPDQGLPHPDYEDNKADDTKKDKKTLLVRHPLCLQHLTCRPITRQGEEPPNENVGRLSVLTNPTFGSLRAKEFKSNTEWEEDPPRAALADVLRVHEYQYVTSLVEFCETVSSLRSVRHLDPDTTVSRLSMDAAMRAAGAVQVAIDRVVKGDNKNAFVAIRPPGHHAGPMGIVTCEEDRHGSHGFCLLNNVAIGAAYARVVYRDLIKKVAIIDFDVHHGNGTEAIIDNLHPHWIEAPLLHPMMQGSMKTLTFKPWLDPSTDSENIFFASVHGFAGKGGGFYPGSGATCNIDPDSLRDPNLLEGSVHDDTDRMDVHNDANQTDDKQAEALLRKQEKESKYDFLHSIQPQAEEDLCQGGGRGTVWYRQDDGAAPRPPYLINVGIEPGDSVNQWRRGWRDSVISRLVEFDPDLILVSAGFDGHKKDIINHGIVGVDEDDYYWLTKHLVRVANTCCDGRIVSVLEGGYRIHGKIVSAFSRSVAAHVRAMTESGRPVYNADDCAWERKWQADEEKKQRDAREEELRRQRELYSHDEDAYLAMRRAEIEAQLGGRKRPRDSEDDNSQDDDASVNSTDDDNDDDDDDNLFGTDDDSDIVDTNGGGSHGPSDGHNARTETETGRRSKRQRREVDYVALAKQLDAESEK